jgi:hypothetical protein
VVCDQLGIVVMFIIIIIIVYYNDNAPVAAKAIK